MTLEAENLAACRKFQSFYDETLCRRVGITAPQPQPGEDIQHYRARALNLFKRTFLPQVHDYYVGYHALSRADSNAFNNFERDMLRACVVEANNPAHVPPGELRKIEERDEYGGVKQIRFVGQESFVKAMTRPGRRVVSFNTSNGPVSASGMFLR
jgi:hypothetical protein